MHHEQSFIFNSSGVRASAGVPSYYSQYTTHNVYDPKSLSASISTCFASGIPQTLRTASSVLYLMASACKCEGRDGREACEDEAEDGGGESVDRKGFG